MAERPGWHEYFLGIADSVAARGDCSRRQVGAVIVNTQRRIVSTGYNGAPAGGGSCLEGDCPRGKKTRAELPSFEEGNSDYTDCIAIHAEMNALLFADRSSVEGGTLYITCPPCGECWKPIQNSGVDFVVFRTVGGGFAVQKLRLI